MKDYKAECDKLKGQLQELEKQLRYERDRRERRERREALDADIRDRFKELLIDVLGR